jgi:hypothetical protein
MYPERSVCSMPPLGTGIDVLFTKGCQQVKDQGLAELSADCVTWATTLGMTTRALRQGWEQMVNR